MEIYRPLIFSAENVRQIGGNTKFCWCCCCPHALLPYSHLPTLAAYLMSINPRLFISSFVALVVGKHLQNSFKRSCLTSFPPLFFSFHKSSLKSCSVPALSHRTAKHLLSCYYLRECIRSFACTAAVAQANREKIVCMNSPTAKAIESNL